MGLNNSINTVPTTVGGNIVTLTNPSAIRYIRINADNSITALTAAQLQTDLGISGIDAAYTDFSGVGGCNAQGFSALTDNSLWYKQIGKTVFIIVRIVGTSNSTTFSFTLPVTPSATITDIRPSGSITSGGSQSQGRVTIAGGSTTATVQTGAGGSPSNAGGKSLITSFFYEGT